MQKDYLPTIGLEIHVELKTRTKMFCACLNDPDETEPNKNVCPVCLAHPGTLPVINLEAVKKVLRVGLALGGEIPSKSFFDRKNYFYPDLPKGYQISQYDHPLVSGGSLPVIFEDGQQKVFALTRIHLEEDTGKLFHQEKKSLIDYNRAGRPLMELVTAPVFHSGLEARRFAEELHLLLLYLDVSEAGMEKGQMRIEPNISVSDSSALGTKVEIKNLNSFRSVEDSINYEIKRQIEVLESGNKISQENRGWDQQRGETFLQRSKEEAHDYRYFPEPDLPPLLIDSNGEGYFISTDQIKRSMPELPWQKRERLAKIYGLNAVQVEVLVQNQMMADYFEEIVSEFAEKDKQHQSEAISEKAILAYNFITSNLLGLMAEAKEVSFKNLKFKNQDLAGLINYFHRGQISSAAAKVVLLEMFEAGRDCEEIIKEKNLLQVSDSKELEAIVAKILAENPGPVADIKNGKLQVIQFLVGKIMAETRGKANPKLLVDLIRKKI